MPRKTPPKKSVRAPKGHDQPFPAATPTSLYQDFRSGASWRVFRIMAEFIEGFEFLADLGKEVTIFGSARVRPDSRWYEEAQKLGGLLGKAGFTVITGGGPGIMEAANHGAFDVGAESVGLNIELPKEQRINQYVKRGKGFYYFFTRKVMLSISAQAYIYFPGGVGTVNEFFEIYELFQTKKSEPLPIVLVGKEFWGGVVAWMKKEMIEGTRYMEPDDLKLFTIVDSAEEAFNLVKDTPERQYP